MTPARWPSKSDTLPRSGWIWGLLLLLALVGTVLLHGCHGPDEDHELFRESPLEQMWRMR